MLVFDERFLLRTVSAQAILADDFNGLLRERSMTGLANRFSAAIRSAFAEYGSKEWQTQIELDEPGGPPKILLLRGTQLPEGVLRLRRRL